MVRIAIVEDEQACADRLQTYIERCCKENGVEATVRYFSDGEEIASDYSADYDIIFMDIVMKHLNGMKTAELIRTLDKNVIIVFITSRAQYAIKGYAVDALSYLLKPIEYFAFSQEFRRCIDKLKRKRKRYLLFSTENGKARIATEDILYIESLNHHMLITAESGQYCVYDTMRNLEAILRNEGFARCNNCYLVNLAYVTAVHGDYVVLGGKELKISRHKKKNFLEALAEKFAAF